MKRDIMRKWVKALESGDYKQGEGRLRHQDKFCCLGVLTNLHAIEHPEFAATQTSKHSYDNEEAVCPPIVVKWAGLNSDNGHYSSDNGTVESLATDNDYGHSFADIAKTIRKHWREL